MDQQRILHLLVSRAMDFITRLDLHTPAALASQLRPSPHKRLLFISSFSLGLALVLVWVGAGLSRSAALGVAFALGSTGYVANTGFDGLNDCSLATSPCLTVQQAADKSTAGGEIRIARGTYTGVSVRAMVTQVVYISRSLTLRGGYTTTDSFAVSNPVANPTILDAQLNNARAVFITGTNVAGDIENLTVQNGNIQGDGLFDCPSAGCGGGIFASGALTLTNVTGISNTAAHAGGAAYAFGPTTLIGGLFVNNTGRLGGGLYTRDALRLTDTQFLGNTAFGGGGGAFADGAVTLNGGVFDNNTANVFGGGLYTNDTLWLTGTLFLSNTVISGFPGFGAGGGAHVFRAATFNGGLFDSNSCAGSNCVGGALFARNTLTVTGTKFLRNGSERGGSIYQIIGTARMVNTLFADNIASAGVGAALLLNSPLSVQILHTTIAGPTFGSGSAIEVLSGTVGITDTIVASYTTGINVTGGTAYENYNLFFGNGTNHAGTTGGTNDVLNGDPRFIGTQIDNYHLNVGSAAIDRGVNTGVATDIDGDVRPFGGGYDIGYDEWIGKLLYLPLVRR